MSREGMADSAELTILTKALDSYCQRHRIPKGPERDDIAFRVMQLFQEGVIDPHKLSDGLDKLIPPPAERKG